MSRAKGTGVQSSDEDDIELVEVVETRRNVKRAVKADRGEEQAELQSDASSQPIRSGKRIFPSRAGTNGKSKKEDEARAQSGRHAAHSSAAVHKQSQHQSLRLLSPSGSGSASTSTSPHPHSAIASPSSAAESSSKRAKLVHPTWATEPPSRSSSALSSVPPIEDTPLRGRGIPSVVIPHIPLETLRHYIHPPGTSRITARYAPESSGTDSDPDDRSEDRSESESELESEYEGTYGRMTIPRAAKRQREEVVYSYSEEESTDPLARSADDSDEGTDDSMADQVRRTRGADKRQKGSHRKSNGNVSSRYAPRTTGRNDKRKPATLDSSDLSDPDSETYEDDQEGEDELDSADEDPEDSDFSEEPSRKKRRKGQGKGKGKKAVEVDEETAEEILGKHRGFCEKCQRIPAQYLLEAAQRRKAKGKQKKRKEEDDFELDEVEQAIALGGWLECDKCVTSWHWGCLGQHQKDDVFALLLRAESPRPWGKKRQMVEVDEAYGFECRKCQNSPACFVCHEVDLPARDVKRGKDEGVNGAAEEVTVGQTANKGANAVTANGKEPEDNVNGAMGGKEDSEDGAIVMLDGPSGSSVHPDRKGKGVATLENGEEGEEEEPLRSTLRFRCFRCKQGAHYEHLPKPPRATDTDEWSVLDRAEYYQNVSGVNGRNAWFCHQCREWTSTVDIVIAWRPAPHTEPEPNEVDYKPSWKDDLPREYLVRFAGRGFRHVEWVSHAWLRSMAAPRLRKFLDKGPALDLITDETLAAKGDDMAAPTISNVLGEADDAESARQSRHAPHGEAKGKDVWLGVGPGPEVDAKAGLPIEWSTVDRVLDVCLRMPPSGKAATKASKSAKVPPKARNPRNRIESDSELDESGATESKEVKYDLPAFVDGLEPYPEDRIEIDEWERLNHDHLNEGDVDRIIGLVTWCFVKWDDLQYDQSTWDTPPPKDSTLYSAFKRALGRYLKARRVVIPILDKSAREKRDNCVNKKYTPPEEQPGCVIGGKLMPFQLNGLQWMLTKHYKRESAILADDMGLGKTVQIASLLGYLGEKKVYPCLVVVPNSTITNWVREFEKWVPHMRVVPYYGEASSRKIIKQYELYHKGMSGKAEGLKAHIVLTTYDMITGADFKVYAGIPRWEVLCVDEGQRLKSDSSLIFARLRKLNSVHRLLLTGTPLNNNIRELFNLLNFLDPHKFTDRDELESRYAQDELNEEKIHELHEIVKPYILRRIKADVLKLPPKIEIIVPISLSPLQKHLYRLIVDRNVEHIKAVAEARQKKAKAKEVRDKEAAAKREAKEAREREERETEGGGARIEEIQEEADVQAEEAGKVVESAVADNESRDRSTPQEASAEQMASAGEDGSANEQIEVAA